MTKRLLVKAGLCVVAVAAALLPGVGPANAVKGGEHTTHAEYPWQVVITRTGSAHPQKISCGGSLVRPNKVLTAAHCMDPTFGDIKDKTVVWGRTDMTGTDGTVAKITSFWKHPDYQWGSLAGDDIAILTLDQNVGTPSSLLPIATAAEADLHAVGKSNLLTTHGKTGSGTTPADYDPVMKKASLPVIDPDATGGCKNIGWTFTPEKQLCYGPVKNDTTGVCSGDSGSPMVASTPAGFRQVGLVESGDSTCQGPQVMAKLTTYETLLRQQLGDQPGNDFSVSVAPTALSVPAGQSAAAKVSTAVTAGSAQTVALSASGLPSGVTATFEPASVSTGASSSLTLSASASASAGTATVTVTAAGTTTKTASLTLTVTGGSGGGLTNGGFESGGLTGWTAGGTGASSTVVTSGAHGGSYAARLGAATATNGESTLSQTFTAASAGQLSFWYSMTCPDTVRYAWARATLKNNTTGAVTTPLAKTCTNGQGWKQVTAQLSQGQSYTLTLVNRDDNHPNDPVSTLYDDVALTSGVAVAATRGQISWA